MNQILFTHVAFEENMHSNKAFNKPSVPSVPIKAYIIGRSKGRPHIPHYVSYYPKVPGCAWPVHLVNVNARLHTTPCRQYPTSIFHQQQPRIIDLVAPPESLRPVPYDLTPSAYRDPITRDERAAFSNRTSAFSIARRHMVDRPDVYLPLPRRWASSGRKRRAEEVKAALNIFAMSAPSI